MAVTGFPIRGRMSSLEVFTQHMTGLITPSSVVKAQENISEQWLSGQILLDYLVIVLAVDKAQKKELQHDIEYHVVKELYSNIAPIIKKAIFDKTLDIYLDDCLHNDVVIETGYYPKDENIIVLRDDFIKWQKVTKSTAIPAILQKIVETDIYTTSQQVNMGVCELSMSDFILRKKSLLTKNEAACLISGDSVISVEASQNDTNFHLNYADFMSAISLIESCIHANEVDCNNGYISKGSLVKTLIEKEIFIQGFNDDISQGLADNGAAKVAEQSKLLAENAKLKQRIAELERQLKHSSQAANKPNDIDLLAYILDSTQEHYAPDLALSIQLYKYVYIDKLRQDSHSSMANSWVGSNTNYDISKQSASRIREITTPFKSWNSNRDKNYFKP